jgi:hypothetical protein
MKTIIIGGGEAGLHLLSWLSADPSNHIPLVIEPDRQALIHRVESLGFRWRDASSGEQPPDIRETIDAIRDVADPDLIAVSAGDAALVEAVRVAAPPGAPVLTSEDLALCDRWRCMFKEPARLPPGEAAGDQSLEEFLERLLAGAAWPTLLARMLWLMQLISGACGGALFVHRGWGRRLLFEAGRGVAACSAGEQLFFRGAAQLAVDEQRAVRVVCGDHGSSWTELVALPLVLEERPIGAVVLALPEGEARLGQESLFVLSWITVRLISLLCRGLQMEWARESMVRDAIRRGIKEIIGRELPAPEACRLGVEVIAGRLSAASCRLYGRGPRMSGWLAQASSPAGRVGWADPRSSRDPVMLTAVSLEPLPLIQGSIQSGGRWEAGGEAGLLYVPFSLGLQGDGVFVIEGRGIEQWSTQLIELLKEMGQLLGTVAQRVTEG